MKVLPRGVKQQLGRLNALSTGPAALRMPQNVSRLELRLQRYVNESSYGAKNFWRANLPPIQFYNPHLQISVKRYSSSNIQPELIIEFHDGSSKSVLAANKTTADLLQELISATGAESIPEEQQNQLGV